jgi:hypothetical protein
LTARGAGRCGPGGSPARWHTNGGRPCCRTARRGGGAGRAGRHAPTPRPGWRRSARCPGGRAWGPPGGPPGTASPSRRQPGGPPGSRPPGVRALARGGRRSACPRGKRPVRGLPPSWAPLASGGWLPARPPPPGAGGGTAPTAGRACAGPSGRPRRCARRPRRPCWPSPHGPVGRLSGPAARALRSPRPTPQHACGDARRGHDSGHAASPHPGGPCRPSAPPQHPRGGGGRHRRHLVGQQPAGASGRSGGPGPHRWALARPRGPRRCAQRLACGLGGPDRHGPGGAHPRALASRARSRGAGGHPWRWSAASRWPRSSAPGGPPRHA